MKVVLMNSAMMPADGQYSRRTITREEFVKLLRASPFESYIGYPETAAFVERIAGVSVPVNRGQTVLDGPTMILVCKLEYRVQNPQEKGKFVPRDDDYEFIVVTYKPA